MSSFCNNMEHEKSMRKKILYLLEAFLVDNGYEESADCFRSEAKLSDEYTICDNIRLETIITEYKIYYYQRFKIYPEICKKINYCTTGHRRYTPKTKKEVDKPRCKSTGSDNCSSKAEFKPRDSNLEIIPPDFMIKCTSLVSDGTKKMSTPDNEFMNNDELKEYKHLILQTINSQTVEVHWENVKGLEDTKKILKEAIIYPIKYPHVFSTGLEPWKSILMYGPPGTGKTLLAKAATTESGATMFNISCSTLINKWRGDTEKLIKVLFDVAENKAPSIIFIDEIDAIASKRCIQEHEASRRMKSELFISVDGLINSMDNKVVLLATTNTPWDLDEAMLRRFEKHIYIPPPDLETRVSLLERFLPNIICQDPMIEIEIDYHSVAQLVDHYSGSDISNLCKEIRMSFMREIFSQLESNTKKSFTAAKKRKVSLQDFKTALQKFKPISFNLEEKYIKWKNEYG